MARCAFIIDNRQCSLKPGHSEPHMPENATDEHNAVASISKTFAYHRPTADARDTINQLRANFSAMKERIETLCPNSRERSIALTDLETCAMWAIKSVVINDPQSAVEL